MKTFANVNAKDFPDAVRLAQQGRHDGNRVSFSGGGSDLLGLVKERLVTPDVVVNLRKADAHDETAGVHIGDAGARIGGVTTLNTPSRDPAIRRAFTVLAEAAEGIATPQIRNVGTLAGNVCQRPWCWYYRNGFPCYKAGGHQCFSFAGENQFHAIFGGGPSYIVHPSDTAPALVALDATFRLVGPSGERAVSATDFFVLPRLNALAENVLGDDELLGGVEIPALPAGSRSAYHRSWTASPGHTRS